MNIGIVGYFNPYEVREYLPKDMEVPCINTTASSVNATVRGLLQEGHYVRVFTSYPFNGLPTHIKGKGIDIYFISSECNIKGSGYFIRIYMANRIKREIRKNIEGLDVLHAQWTYDFALAAKHFTHKLPVFCSVRDWCPYIYSLARGIKDRLFWFISLLVFRRVMYGNKIHFIANSDYTLSQIKSQYPQKDVTIIANPIIKENILNNKKSASEEQIFISIAQSFDEPRKNIENLLLAFKKYRCKKPNSKLVLIGNYSTVSYNKWKSSQLLDNVELTGALNKEDCYKELDKATVLIHPSIEETFGNTLLEGMARCLPCIGGIKSGAVPKVLGDGKFGILCDVKNVDSIVSAMMKTEDKQFVKELTEKCTNYLIQNFSNNVIAKQHVELYRKYL